MFVWCATGINELADKKKELSIDLLGALFDKHKILPEVAVVCMTYGARWVGEKLRDLGVSNVVSISADPFGNDPCLLGTALVKFCVGILAGDDGNDDPLETFRTDLGKIDPEYECNPIPIGAETPCLGLGGRSIYTQEPMSPNIILKFQPCCGAYWFPPKELRKLRLDAADLPLLHDIRDDMFKDPEYGDSVCYYLKPYDGHGLEKEETWDPVRALALHICNEIENDVRFRCGVHRVSSMEEADRLQCDLMEREGAALVWLDIVNKQSIPFRSGKDWTERIGESVSLHVLATSVAQCLSEAEELAQNMNVLSLEEPSQFDISEVHQVEFCRFSL